MFDSLQKRLSTALAKVRGKTRISEQDITEVLSEIRTGLLEGDVHFRVTKDFLARVKARCLAQEVLDSLSPEQHILKILQDELTQIFGASHRALNLEAAPPVVIMLCGLQGSGKTTTTAKLAAYLKAEGKRVGVVSVDVQRPAAIEQLRQLAEKVEVDVFPSSSEEKPSLIAERALKLAREQNVQVLLIDTAGRLQIDNDLMSELAEVKKISAPTETLLVVDAMMGQQAVEVAEGFDAQIQLTGSILTKLDGDTRGGAALSLVAVTGKPIKFIGTGERSSELEVFHPDRMASRLLDMGDVLSLIEKAEKVIDQDEAKAAAEKMMGGDFTLEDFRSQLRMISKMGSLGSIMKMMPGMGAMKEQLESADTEAELKRVNAIMDSMTVKERRQPDILNGSRRARIARGSGTEASDVNSLVKRFLEARKMMKNLGGMGKMLKGLGGGGGGNPFGGGGNPFGGGGGGRGKGFGRKF